MSVRSGFTMLELLVVLAVIGLTAGVVVARLGGLRTRHVVEDAAAQIVDQARRCRDLAVARGQTVRLRLDPAQTTVGVLAPDGESDPADGLPTEVVLREGADDLTLSLLRDDGQTMSDTPIEVLFRADGRSDPTGLVVLRGAGQAAGVRLAMARAPAREAVEATP